MPLTVPIQMDPIEKIDIGSDSTFALSLEAQRRGHSLLYYGPRDLTLKGDKVTARARPLTVRDKRGDIAILRSFGTTPRSVLAIFASQGTFIGLLGTLLGIALALLFTWQLGNIVALLQGWLGITLLSADVYFLSDLPTQLRFAEIAEIAALALGLAVLATFYPAFSASRQPPAEALRYE